MSQMWKLEHMSEAITLWALFITVLLFLTWRTDWCYRRRLRKAGWEIQVAGELKIAKKCHFHTGWQRDWERVWMVADMRDRESSIQLMHACSIPWPRPGPCPLGLGTSGGCGERETPERM